MMSVIKILKCIFNSSQRRKIRRIKRKSVNSIMSLFIKKNSLSMMSVFFTEKFGLKKGDTIILTSSFANLNADFSPEELILLLQQIVGYDGLILMPYYPNINSTEFVKKGKEFDMLNTPSGMGILTNVFSKMPNVYMSHHPIKAVCAWGSRASTIIANHHLADTPFDISSPYGKILFADRSFSVGIGATQLPMFHAIEDFFLHYYMYLDDVYSVGFIDDNNNRIKINTRVHDENIISKMIAISEYVRNLNCKSYKRFHLGYSYSYIIENKDLFQTCETEFLKNGKLR